MHENYQIIEKGTRITLKVYTDEKNPRKLFDDNHPEMAEGFEALRKELMHRGWINQDYQNKIPLDYKKRVKKLSDNSHIFEYIIKPQGPSERYH